jgi:hypothetical protein
MGEAADGAHGGPDVGGGEFVGGRGGAGDVGAAGAVGCAAAPLVAVGDGRRAGPRAAVGGQGLSVARAARDGRRAGVDRHGRPHGGGLGGSGACRSGGVRGGHDHADGRSDVGRRERVARARGARNVRAARPIGGAAAPPIGVGHRRCAIPGSAIGGEGLTVACGAAHRRCDAGDRRALVGGHRERAGEVGVAGRRQVKRRRRGGVGERPVDRELVGVDTERVHVARIARRDGGSVAPDGRVEGVVDRVEGIGECPRAQRRALAGAAPIALPRQQAEAPADGASGRGQEVGDGDVGARLAAGLQRLEAVIDLEAPHRLGAVAVRDDQRPASPAVAARARLDVGHCVGAVACRPHERSDVGEALVARGRRRVRIEDAGRDRGVARGRRREAHLGARARGRRR